MGQSARLKTSYPHPTGQKALCQWKPGPSRGQAIDSRQLNYFAAKKLGRLARWVGGPRLCADARVPEDKVDGFNHRLKRDLGPGS